MQPVPQGWFSRSRSLADFDKKFGAETISRTIQQRLRPDASAGDVRLLEIGCGEGRVLMELRRMFPGVEFHGINRNTWPAMMGSQSLPATAQRYGILEPAELTGVALPIMHFYDAEKLSFSPDYFDVIISQVCIPYVARKDSLIEEVWRTLKPGGVAFLHLDSTRGGDPRLLGGDSPCFVLHRDHQRLPVAELFAALRLDGYDLQYQVQPFQDEGEERVRYLLVMTKNTDSALRLMLAFDEQASFDLTRLHKQRQDWKHLWGFRSVYRAG